MLKLLIPIILFFVWYLVGILELVNPILIPTLQDTILSAGQLLTSNDFWIDCFSTVSRMLAGLFLAAIIGIIMGVLMGSFPTLYEILIPVVDFFRSTPVTVLYPLFVLFLGVGSSSKVAMIFTACVFVIALNTAYGVLRASKLRAASAKLYGASRRQVIFHVTFWDSLPQTMVGLRISLSLALIVSILVEMFMGSENGLGQRVIEAYTSYRIPEMYLMILVVGFIGYTFNLIFTTFERSLVGWSNSENAPY